MGFQSISDRRREFERQLHQTCHRKLVLLRALPYNCVGGSCFIGGRDSVSKLCPVCGGTGYLGGQIGDDPERFLGLPYNQVFLLLADLQPGHGLFGAGGTLTEILADLGKAQTGDATLFCPIQSLDGITGQMFAPRVDTSLVRPDRIISVTDRLYFVTETLEANIGDDVFALVCTLSLQPGGK